MAHALRSHKAVGLQWILRPQLHWGAKDRAGGRVGAVHPAGVFSAQPHLRPTPGSSGTSNSPRRPECGVSLLRRGVGTGWGEASGAASPGLSTCSARTSAPASSTPGNAWAGGDGCVEHPEARGACCGRGWALSPEGLSSDGHRARASTGPLRDASPRPELSSVSCLPWT